jgi:hypothetical protein
MTSLMTTLSGLLLRSRRIATTDALPSAHGEVIARCNEDQGSYTMTLLRANLELILKAFPNDSDGSLDG